MTLHIRALRPPLLDPGGGEASGSPPPAPRARLPLSLAPPRGAGTATARLAPDWLAVGGRAGGTWTRRARRIGASLGDAPSRGQWTGRGVGGRFGERAGTPLGAARSGAARLRGLRAEGLGVVWAEAHSVESCLRPGAQRCRREGPSAAPPARRDAGGGGGRRPQVETHGCPGVPDARSRST